MKILIKILLGGYYNQFKELTFIKLICFKTNFIRFRRVYVLIDPLLGVLEGGTELNYEKNIFFAASGIITITLSA